jgi:hypothetical protein
VRWRIGEPASAEARQAFATRGYAIFRKAFEKQHLDALRAYLDHEARWHRVVRLDDYQNDFELEDPELPSWIDRLRDERHRSRLAYTFERTLPDENGCPCALCEFWRGMLHPDTRQWVEELSGHRISRYQTRYATRFRRGDFLSVHTDPYAKVGFVLNLTGRWRVDWGGLLHFLDRETMEVEHTVSPAIGTLVVFEIERFPTPHFVSDVAGCGNQARLSLTGRWI